MTSLHRTPYGQVTRGLARKLEAARRARGAKFLALCLVAFFLAACAQGGREDTSQLRKEIDELKAEQKKILEEIRQLKGEDPFKSVSPAKKQLPFEMALDAGSREVKGSKSARVALVEFSDFQCSYCLSYVTQTFPQINREYIETGKVRYVFRNLPLTGAHPNAFRAAEAAHCAAEQGKFWEAHDRFFANQNALNPDDWPAHARALGLDAKKFDECLASGQYDDAINSDIEDAQRAGITGTPAFLIGVISPDGSKVSVSKMIMGAEGFTSFKKALDELLSSTEK